MISFPGRARAALCSSGNTYHHQCDPTRRLRKICACAIRYPSHDPHDFLVCSSMQHGHHSLGGSSQKLCRRLRPPSRSRHTYSAPLCSAPSRQGCDLRLHPIESSFFLRTQKWWQDETRHPVPQGRERRNQRSDIEPAVQMSDECLSSFGRVQALAGVLILVR